MCVLGSFLSMVQVHLRSAFGVEFLPQPVWLKPLFLDPILKPDLILKFTERIPTSPAFGLWWKEPSLTDWKLSE
jgi:hypothetical protein